VIPYDSFLLDPPMLVGSGYLTARITRRLTPAARARARRVLGLATITGFWVTSVSLYLNLEWTRWIWEMCGAESGRDWMLNSGVLSFEHEEPSPATHAVSAAILATYPLWFRLGVRAGSRGD
jgi:hypothetical protein